MKKKFLVGLAIGFLVFGMVGMASASVIVNGSIYNIDADSDGGVDDLIISRIYFDVTAGTRLFMDSLVWESTGVDLNGDGELTGFDNYMRLFSGATSLADNDDSSSTFGDGSVHPYDSTIDYTFATAGTYMVTLGQLWYDTSEALIGYDLDRLFYDYMESTPYATGRPKDHGDWRLTFNVLSGELSNVTGGVPDNPVPEPSTILLLGFGLVGLAGVARKKMKN